MTFRFGENRHFPVGVDIPGASDLLLRTGLFLSIILSAFRKKVVALHVTSDVNGEQQHEKMLITYESGTDLMSVLHKLGLEYALTPNGIKSTSKPD